MSGSILDRIANPAVLDINPLANYKAALDVNSALNQNKAFQANVLRGQLLQQATDPDGTVNMPRYNQLASQAGDALAPAMAAGVDQSQAIVGSQQDQALKSLKTQQGMLGSLMSDNDGAGPDYQRVLDTINSGLETGAVQPHGAQAVLTGMPTGDDPKSRATRLHQIQTINEQLTSAEQRLNNATGTAGTMSDNKVNQPGMVGGQLSANPGAFTPSGPGTVLKTGPETNATLVKTWNPQTGQFDFTPRSALPGADGDTTTTTSPLGSGNFPSALLKPANRSGGAGPVSASAGPGPQTEAAATETGGQSAKAFADMPNQAAAAQTRAAVLDNMLGDISQFTTGPMTDRITNVKAIAQKLGFSVDTEGLKAAESFNKLAAQLAQSQNPGSDARLNVSQAANPHSDLSPGGVDLMLRQLRGNEDYIMQRSKLASAYPDKGNYSQFQNDIGSKLDPRVFQYNRMTGPQAETFLNSMKDANQFKKNYRWAEAQKLVGGGQN